MIQAGVEWNFHDRPGTPQGFATTTTLGHPRHLHECSGYRSTMKMLALFKDISSGAKQNPVTRNAVVHQIPEQKSGSRPN